MVRGRQVNNAVSFDVNPTSRQILGNLSRQGYLSDLIQAGARIHQAGCNGCIGMGQAPATHKISLRTVPRNFPGRSGTSEDMVYLCSPETATASALTGVITDPRDLDMPYPQFEEPKEIVINIPMLEPPFDEKTAKQTELIKGPNIKSFATFDRLPDSLDLPVLLKVGDDISTDEIMPAGQRVLPYRSNIEKMSEFVFADVDHTFYERARQTPPPGFAIVAGNNYGQGSSREHAALVPRFLGLRVVIARSFARIHRQNLVNFGVLPLIVSDENEDLAPISRGDRLVLADLHGFLNDRREIEVRVPEKDRTLRCHHNLSPREIEIVLSGGLLNHIRRGK
jgi:aconitate hydratase